MSLFYYPLKCEDCIHRLKTYCRAYQEVCNVLNVENCKRKEEVEDDDE